jgi:hypothetical protein
MKSVINMAYDNIFLLPHTLFFPKGTARSPSPLGDREVFKHSTFHFMNFLTNINLI